MPAITISKLGQKITRQALPTTETSFPVTVNFACRYVVLEIIPDTPARYATTVSTVVADGAPITGPSAVLDIPVASGDTFYLCAQSVAGNVDFIVVDVVR